VPPRSVSEKTDANIQRWTEMEKGGHFAATEQPAALAAEIRDFFRQLRSFESAVSFIRRTIQLVEVCIWDTILDEQFQETDLQDG
jgi:hypothetical protein